MWINALLSIFVNILIGISGVIPSYFVTGFNLSYFGFWPGLAVSFIGESLGAVTAFVIYRKYLRGSVNQKLRPYPKIISLVEMTGKDAFMMIIYLRVLPFMPSGLVTLGGAAGRVSLLSFALASSLGKIPAMFIEALTVYQVLEFNPVGFIQDYKKKNLLSGGERSYVCSGRENESFYSGKSFFEG